MNYGCVLYHIFSRIAREIKISENFAYPLPDDLALPYGLVVGMDGYAALQPKIFGRTDKMSNKAVGSLRPGSASVGDAEPAFIDRILARTVENYPCGIQWVFSKKLTPIPDQFLARMRFFLRTENEIPAVDQMKPAAIRRRL